MLAGQVLERLQAVVDENESFVYGCKQVLIVDDGIGTSLLEGLQGELVAVERLAFEGEEDASLRTITAVCRDAGMLLIELV